MQRLPGRQHMHMPVFFQLHMATVHHPKMLGRSVCFEHQAAHRPVDEGGLFAQQGLLGGSEGMKGRKPE
jgi:hypothetical protein